MARASGHDAVRQKQVSFSACGRQRNRQFPCATTPPARVVELADTPVLEAGAARLEGSSPFPGTNVRQAYGWQVISAQGIALSYGWQAILSMTKLGMRGTSALYELRSTRYYIVL